MRKILVGVVAVVLMALFLLVSSETSAKVEGLRQTAYVLEATTGAISWTIGPADAFYCPRIGLKLSATPSTSEEVVVTLDSHQGTAYDYVILAVDPSLSSGENVSFENITDVKAGDKLKITYTNTDGRTITGYAICAI